MMNKLKIFTKMNFTVLSQLVSIAFIVLIGPAVIAYLAYKKAL